MAETKIINRLSVVTDTETGQENIGDIDGGMFDEEWLKEHVRNHGSEGLLEKLAFMTYQVVEAIRSVNSEDMNLVASYNAVIDNGREVQEKES